jgi:hypothetical protein
MWRAYRGSGPPVGEALGQLVEGPFGGLHSGLQVVGAGEVTAAYALHVADLPARFIGLEGDPDAVEPGGLQEAPDGLQGGLREACVLTRS